MKTGENKECKKVTNNKEKSVKSVHLVMSQPLPTTAPVKEENASPTPEKRPKLSEVLVEKRPSLAEPKREPKLEQVKTTVVAPKEAKKEYKDAIGSIVREFSKKDPSDEKKVAGGNSKAPMTKVEKASNIKVNSLRLENEAYKPYKGVRTITKHGAFEIRT